MGWKHLLRHLFRAKTDESARSPGEPEILPPFEHMEPHQKLRQLERWGEEAYTRMYDALRPSGDYSDAKDNFRAAIALAADLGLDDEAERLDKRLEHIKAVFRSQFS